MWQELTTKAGVPSVHNLPWHAFAQRRVASFPAFFFPLRFPLPCSSVCENRRHVSFSTMTYLRLDTLSPCSFILSPCLAPRGSSAFDSIHSLYYSLWLLLFLVSFPSCYFLLSSVVVLLSLTFAPSALLALLLLLPAFVCSHALASRLGALGVTHSSLLIRVLRIVLFLITALLSSLLSCQRKRTCNFCRCWRTTCARRPWSSTRMLLVS